MSSMSGHDELLRAAAAAGFAMATAEDDLTTADRQTSSGSKVSVEELARGGRAVPATEMQALAVVARHQTPTAPRGLMASANTVRETVYGYLGFGVPA